jgi:NAD(P)H-hydrate epimerase
MLAITCNEMKQMDTYAIKDLGIPSILLMENAAFRVMENIDLEKYHRFTIICSVGNNGSDGLAIARQLMIKNKAVDIFVIGDVRKGTENFKAYFNFLTNIDINYVNITKKDDLYKLQKSLEENDMTIDALFGLGLSKNIDDLYFDVISFTNHYSVYTLSVDIPSGLNCDTGDVMGIAIKADKTVTFHMMKKGLLDREGYTGKIVVTNIGIPDKATNAVLKTSL